MYVLPYICRAMGLPCHLMYVKVISDPCIGATSFVVILGRNFGALLVLVIDESELCDTIC